MFIGTVLNFSLATDVLALTPETRAASNPALRKTLQSTRPKNLPASSTPLLDSPIIEPTLSGFLSLGVQEILPLVIDRADAIVIPNMNVVLYLYAHLQNNQEIGRVVRYNPGREFVIYPDGRNALSTCFDTALRRGGRVWHTDQSFR